METEEKQSAFFLRSHSAWKTRPRTSSFPQLPQPLRLDIDHSKRHETLNKDAFIYEQEALVPASAPPSGRRSGRHQQGSNQGGQIKPSKWAKSS